MFTKHHEKLSGDLVESILINWLDVDQANSKQEFGDATTLPLRDVRDWQLINVAQNDPSL